MVPGSWWRPNRVVQVRYCRDKQGRVKAHSTHRTMHSEYVDQTIHYLSQTSVRMVYSIFNKSCVAVREKVEFSLLILNSTHHTFHQKYSRINNLYHPIIICLHCLKWDIWGTEKINMVWKCYPGFVLYIERCDLKVQCYVLTMCFLKCQQLSVQCCFTWQLPSPDEPNRDIFALLTTLWHWSTRLYIK